MEIRARQIKAKRDQKIIAAVMAGLVVIFTYLTFPDNIGWLMVAMVYAAVVICVIFVELVDEVWVAARFQEFMNTAPEEHEMVTIDVIS